MQAQTLETLVSLYRRTRLANAEVELEARFRGVNFQILQTVLKSLNDKNTDLAVEDGTISHTVNSIMAENTALTRSTVRGVEKPKTNLIRQLTFDTSPQGKKIGDQYYRKWPLATPYRVKKPHALDYTIALSVEEPMDAPFISDASALIRAKCRASFIVTEGDEKWRVDLTVTRSLQGGSAQTALPDVVKTMFRAGAMTTKNMLDLLGLADPDSESRGLYAYEIEIEHMRSESGDDSIRPSGVSSIVDNILHLANPEYVEEAAYQSEIYHVASYVIGAPGVLRRFENEWGLKKLVPQVTALTRGEYKNIYPPTNYFLLDKADGVRAIASVRDGRLLIMADVLLKYYAPGFGPDAANSRTTLSGETSMRVTDTTIVDGELVHGTPPVFHAFDVITYRSENVSVCGYEKRISYLQDAVGVLRDFGVAAHAKPIVHITASEPNELQAQFKSSAFEQRPYGTDGRILVEPEKPYSDTIAYKWKSLWDTTIDFLARRPPASVLGRRPYVDAPGHELYFLFVGINPNLFTALGLGRVPGYRELFSTRYNSGSYFPIQFSPSDAPYAYLYQHPKKQPKSGRGWEGWMSDIDGKVIELRCAGSNGDCTAAGSFGAPEWQLVRVREDRTREIQTQTYFGNDFRIAELTWLNYVDPFNESQLWDGPTTGYFMAPKSAMYRAQTAFTSFIKSRRIGSLSHARWVVDAAVGKGQDLGRYMDASVRHIVGIDVDRGALSELIRRKYSHARGKKKRQGSTALFALRADLTSPHEDVARKVRSISGFPGGQLPSSLDTADVANAGANAPVAGADADIGADAPVAGADALVINLAIHYLAENVGNLRNFIALCRDLVKVGGMVIITTMFGERVHQFLAENNVKTGESWDSRQDGVLKYSIRRDYVEPRITAAGQKIGVLLPFSSGEYYEEYMVNVKALADEFTDRGFSLVGTPTFDEAFDEFKTRNPNMYKHLTVEDFRFLRLYGEILLKREK